MRWPPASGRSLFAGLALGLCLLIGSLVLLLLSPPGRRWTLARFGEAVAAQGLTFQAKDVSYRLFSPRVSLEEPRFATRDGAPLLDAARIDIDVTGRRAMEVTLTAPKINIVIDDLPQFPKSEGSGSSITIERVRLIDGELHVRDKAGSLSVDLPRWQAIASRLPGGEYRAEFSTDARGRATYEGRNESIDSARLVYSGTAVETLELITGLGRLEASGAVEPALDLNVNANAADLAKLLGDLRGSASANLHLTGTTAKPLISGSVNGSEMFWQGQGPVNAQTNFALNENMDRVALTGVRADWLGAAVAGTAEIGRTGRSRADLQLSGLDTRQIEPLIKQKIPVATKISGNVSATWPGPDGFLDAVGRASVQFSAWPGRVDLVADASAWQVKTDRFGPAAATLRADVAIDRRTRALSGTIQVDAPDAGAAAKLVKEDAPAVNGPVVVAATLAGTVAEPEADFELTSSGLQMTQAPKTALAARGHATLAAVRVDSFEAKSGEARITAAGQADIGVGDAALRFDGALEQTPIAAFTTLASGTISGVFSVRGTATKPEATARLTARNLQAYGEALGDGRGELKYDAAGLTIPRFELTKGAGSITASANLAANRATVDIRNFAIDGLKIQEGQVVSGLVNGKADFTGDSLQTGSGTLALAIANLTAAGRTPGRFEIAATLALGEVKGTATAPEWGIESRIQSSVSAPYPATIEATIRGFALENAEPSVTGVATGSLRATGDLAALDTMRGEAELTALKIVRGAEEATNEGPIRVRYADGIADIESATITAGNSRVNVRGQFPVQKGEAALMLDADIDVALAARLAALDPALAPVGRLRAQGTVAGSAPNWKPDVTAHLTGGQLNVPGLSSPLTAINASIIAREGVVKLVEATAALLGGTLAVTGEAPLAATEYKLQAEANGLHLEQLQQGGSQLAGVVNLRAEAEGKGFGVRDVVAKLEAPNLRLQMGELDLAATSTPTVTMRDGLVQIRDFELKGSGGTQFKIRGGTALVAPYPLAVRLDGDLDTALIGLFTSELSAQGRAKVEVALTGTTVNPRLGGSVVLTDAQASIPRAGAVLEHLNARADLLGQQLTLSGITGTLNGGTLTGGGSAELKNGSLATASLTLQSKNSAWNIPEGLETAANIDLKLEGNGQQLSLGGEIVVLEGSYRERMVIERGLLNALQPSAASAAAAGGSSQIPLNVNVRVRTASPILVANDLLNGALNADLRFRGTPQRLGLTGRVNLEEGGTLYLGGRNYLVERASATFTNERKIEPVLDVVAQTRAGGREITLEARGAVGDKLDTRFSSDDGLPEPDVIALLVTGRTLRETRGAEVDIASDQALSYLAGSIGSTVSAQATQALGFKLVRIDPSLIAQEAEPTARLTLGQDLTDRVGLIYSVNLKNSSDQIWIGRVDVTPRFSARVVRQTDNSYRLQFQHDLEFGGEVPPKRTRKSGEVQKVGKVTITGNSPVPEKELRKRFGLRTGKDYDFFKFRKGIDKIKDSLTAKGYPEASVTAERTNPTEGVVDLTLAIEAGQPVQFVYEGGRIPRGVRKKVEQAWSANSFDSLRSRQTKALLLERLVGRGYYEAEVDPSVRDNPVGGKRVLFEISRGKRWKKLEFAFPGAGDENAAALRELFRDKEARRDAVLKPEQARERVTAYYREHGYLEAKVSTRVFDNSAGDGRVRFALPVAEGARYRVGKIVVAGAEESVAPLASGDPYAPAEADRAAERIAESLESKGFTAAETTIAVAPDREEKTVNLTYQVTPGDKKVVGAVEVAGNRLTSESLVRNQVNMKEGEPITSQKLSQARRNLYDTGAFAFTDLELQPGERGPGGVSTRLIARVREVRPFELRYGALYDTERGLGGIVDFSARNVLGGARLAGFRGRYDGKIHEARAYFEQPNLLRFPMKWVTTGFVRREINEGFLTDRVGGSTTAEFRWRRFYRLIGGYRFEKVHTFERVPDPIFPFDIRLRIAPLTAGFHRDTRNDILDATTGSFFSHVAEWAPDKLGSELQYAKYFGQYFHYRPVLGQRRFADAPSRPRLVFAAGARFGIASGLGGQPLIVSERFFSGGGTSVRGFAQDRLGTLPGRTPEGGEAMWVVNGEARVPLFKYADIVGFVDAGNVYRRWRDLSLSDVRFSGGLGIRIRTPYVLIRLDYGIKLNRREGESFGRLFGGIGQAF